jgi:cytochrome P450
VSAIASTGTGPLVFDPYSYAFHEDPYPVYRRLREERPVYYNADLNLWAISRHADVLAAFRDNERLSSANGVSPEPIAYGPDAERGMSFLAMDAPRHLRLRTLVSKGFTPRRIRELGPRVADLARTHLDAALSCRRFDVIADFAGKLPMDVISELVGVPHADRERIRLLADLVMHREEGIADMPAESMEATMTLRGYYRELLAHYRAHPSDNLTTALLEAEVNGDRLTDNEIVGFISLMIIAGNETTTKLLANALYWAWRFPDQKTIVFSAPDAIPDWVEETLRFDTSSQVLARTSTAEITLCDRTIPAGEMVLLLPGSANRDDRVFDEPDEYRVGRTIGTKLLSFGSGVHFCLGAHLARLEANIALTELTKRVRDYEVDVDNAGRVHSTNVRGFFALPVSVTTR